MKKILLILIILISNNLIAGGFKTFVLKGNEYVEKKINIEHKSISNICQFLGYNSEQFYTYSNYNKKDSKIVTVVLKSFSNKIICIITDESVDSLQKNEVDDYMISFDLKKEQRPYTIENTLKKAVEKKSLSFDFLRDVFEIKDIEKNQSFTVPSIGYEFTFQDGYLVEYNTADGLNKWSREWKNSLKSTYDAYYYESKHYNKENENDIINEINIQADAFSRIPQGNYNEYLEFHRTRFNNVNYKMLLVAHYNEKIDIDEFKKINNGRYELLTDFISENGYKNTTYKVNKTLFSFDESGKFVNAYTSK